jgi:hypothetical protein
MSDQTLSDTTPDADPTGSSVFGNPNGPAAAPPVRRMLSVEDVLQSVRLPEKHARICVRADLQAEHDEIVAELATLIDAHGELIEDDGERAVGEASSRDRAQELGDRLTAVRRKMGESMWLPRFRGLSTDELAVFNRQHYPKGENADLTEYNTKLVAECSLDPKMSVDEVKALRKKLGSRAFVALVQTAVEVCTRGGVDVPKSPTSLLNLTQQ